MVCERTVDYIRDDVESGRTLKHSLELAAKDFSDDFDITPELTAKDMADCLWVHFGGDLETTTQEFQSTVFCNKYCYLANKKRICKLELNHSGAHYDGHLGWW
jgi:hypothetical protein